ncbi:MAG: hypothetical protein HY294_07645 [Candidatus Rokubacteria bacterium]|nr:hypothetical protein [Candidatus Rokubacteria bacterium]
MRSLALSLGLLVVVGVGCASVGAPRVPPPVDVTGVWVAKWDNAPWSGPGTLRLEQTGARVVGHVETALVPRRALHGSVTGDHFSYLVSGTTAGGEMTVTGDEMQGYGSATDGRITFHRQR